MNNSGNLHQNIIEFMESSDQKTFEINDLSHGLSMEDAQDFKKLVMTVAELERDGKIVLSDHGAFMLPRSNGHVEGKFRKSQKGYGFVEIEGLEGDVFVPAHRTNHAMESDRVLISIDKASDIRNGKGPEGTVQEILEHGVSHVIGEFYAYDKDELESTPYIGYAELRDKRLEAYTVFITNKGLHPKNESIVQIEITDYPDAGHEKSMVGLVTTEIGGKNDPGVDILSVVYKHGIPTEFSPETLAEVEEIPEHVLEEEKEGRLDLREMVTVTIDGADAKDLDDAISLERLENGNYYLGVHIADVSHYVKEGSSLDADAFERGTSSYLTDRVIPMLPRELSNGICSLHPNVDRLTLSCFMEINHQGHVLNYQIEPSVIRSDQRMTYNAVNGILEDGDPQLYKEYEDYITLFEHMGELHRILERKRYNRGAINFDTKEAQILVDEEGQPVDVIIRSRGIGERLIESFMLQANETVSEHFSKKHLPILYRVHERPDMAKMQSFIEFASALGIRVPGTKDTVSPKQLQRIVENVQGKDEELVVSMTLLRSMQQARYDVEALGHFGLAAEYYSHFTSPIRRYPDLILHRLIHHYQEVGTSKKDQAHYQSILPEIAEQSSIAERRAIDAEREVDNMKKVEFMADKVGQEFEAIIVSVLGFGMFVQLENTVEGLIHISKMTEDYFDYSEQGKMLIGKRTGKTYRMGEKVQVRLAEANTDTYELDFELLVDQTAVGQGKNQSKDQNKSNKNRKSRRRGKRRKNTQDSSDQGQQGRGHSKKKKANQGPAKQKAKKKHFKIIRKDD